MCNEIPYLNILFSRDEADDPFHIDCVTDLYGIKSHQRSLTHTLEGTAPQDLIFEDLVHFLKN